MLRAIIGIILMACGSAFGVSLDARAQTGPPIEWQKCLGGTQSDEGECIVQTSDGGYAISCTAISIDGEETGNHGSGDLWVVKVNDTCGKQWQKCLGGSAEEYAYSIIQTTDGGFAIAGVTGTNNNGDVSGYHGSNDGWVVKLDATGAIQ